MYRVVGAGQAGQAAWPDHSLVDLLVKIVITSLVCIRNRGLFIKLV